ncbi:MAG: AMP-binding protein, partial [Micromonosporaceae bacterium]
LLDRDEWLVAAILGVWRAGAAYVPLDPAYPPQRVRFIAEDTAMPVVLASAGLRGLAACTGLTPVVIDGLDGDGAGEEPPAGGDGPPTGPADDDLAYVMYTSGSTGTPKGVQVEHRNLAGLVE